MQRPAAFTLPRRRLSPWLAGMLVAVLLAAQALGQWHRVDHDARQLAASSSLQQQQHWGHGLDSSDCRALDQLGLHLGLSFALAPQIASSGDAGICQPSESPLRAGTRWHAQARAPPAAAS
jgi:hypothetical protein